MKNAVSLIVLFVVGAVSVAAPARAATIYDLGALKYRAIGPAIAGGRTTAVVGTDLDPQLYFAGGAGGGVFKSSDGGSTWTPVFDAADVAPIGAIAIGPHDANDVWVGTGESNPRNDVEGGDGVWHSTNGGKTWKHVGLDDAGAISSISIDPRDARRVAVGVLGQVFRDSAMRGVYVTGDAGAHWSRALYVGPSSGASDLVRVPGRPSTLFAGLYEFRRKPWTMTSGGPMGGLYRSDDNGATWRKLAGHGLPSGDTGRIGLAAASNGRVYAIIQSKAGDLWRSDDGGATWRLMPHSWLVGGRRFYFTRVFVDPSNADRLIDVGLILSMSTDGGKSFHKIATNAGWDYHQVWWSGNGRRVAIGSDEGAILSSDGGATWRQPYDLPFAQPYHVGFDDVLPNYHVCIGLQDNDSWCGASNGDSGLGVLNRDWSTIGIGDGMWVEYDPLDSHLIWSTSTNSGTGQTYLWDARTQQSPDVSPDAEVANRVPARVLAHRFNWDAPIAFTHDGKALVGGNIVFESADHGQHWSIISPDLTRNERAHQGQAGGSIDQDHSGAETSDTILYIATSTLEDGLIWVGTDDGLVQLTRDGGAHWKDVTPKGAPTWGRVAGVEAGHRAGTAFIAMDNHMLGDQRPYLYMTRDYGATWRSISGDLPSNVFARSIRQDPVDQNLLYAGTQRGMFASWNLGTNWQSLRLNMPATAIYDIEIQPRADDLVVASHGRGVWVLDDLQALQEMNGTTAAGTTLFALRDAYRWFHWSPINSFFPGLPANEFAGPNVAYGALITYVVTRGKHKTATIQILDASGRVVRHLTGKDVPHKAGLNRTAWDLAEDGPTKWKGTFELNQGADEGAEVVPGTYTVRLDVDGVVKERSVAVRFDPRDTTTAAQAQLRHDTLAELYRESGAVNAMLNSLDKRLKTAPPASRVALTAFKHRLTYDPKNDEDLSGPAALRERLEDLIGRIASTSIQAPNQPQLDQAKALRQAYDETAQAFAALR